MAQPFFSIITATFNAGKHLNSCIESIRQQIFNEVEHIIIDGGSNDNTFEIISQNQKQKNSRITYFISEKDNGIYDAWNKGLKEARGEWIYFLGADDTIFSNNTLMNVYEQLKNASNSLLLAYGKVNIISKDNIIIDEWGKPWEISERYISNLKAEGLYMPHQGLFHHKNLFIKYGNWDSRFRVAGDAEYYFRIYSRTNETPLFLNFTIANMRSGGISVSKNTENLRTIEYLRLFLQYQIPKNRLKYYFTIFKYRVKVFCTSSPQTPIKNIIQKLLGFYRSIRKSPHMEI